MICPNCNTEMKEVEVVIKTTSPEEDDVFKRVSMCPKCEHFEPIINSNEYEN